MVKLLATAIGLFISINTFAAHWDDQEIKKILVHDNGSAGYAGVVHVYMFNPG